MDKGEKSDLEDTIEVKPIRENLLEQFPDDFFWSSTVLNAGDDVKSILPELNDIPTPSVEVVLARNRLRYPILKGTNHKEIGYFIQKFKHYREKGGHHNLEIVLISISIAN